MKDPAVHIIEQICALSFKSITHFITHLLSIDTPELQPLTQELKTEESTQLILEALLSYGSCKTIVSWAIEQLCTLFKHEVVRVSNVESRLHFNASNACIDDILSLDLVQIAQIFKDTAPYLWGVIQTLLDANRMAHRRKVPVQATNYDQWHNLEDDLTVHGVESKNDEGSQDDEMVDKELQGKSQGMRQSVVDRVSSLLKIKGCIILLIITNSANSWCNAFQVIQGFFLESVNAPECIINVLAHGSWSVSVPTVVKMVQALTKDHRHII